MNPIRIKWITVGILLATIGYLRAEVVLEFADPESFSDFEYAQTRETISTDYFSKKIIDGLKKALVNNFPEGTVLVIRFTDIDLAGGFEPWQPIRLSDVRFFRDRYPPSARFTYELSGKDGEVIGKGEVSLRDAVYFDSQSRIRSPTNPFYYESRMLEKCVSRDLVKQLAVKG